MDKKQFLIGVGLIVKAENYEKAREMVEECLVKALQDYEDITHIYAIQEQEGE